VTHAEPGRHPKIIAVTYNNAADPGEETLTSTEYGESVVWADLFQTFGQALGMDIGRVADRSLTMKISDINSQWPDMAIMFRANNVSGTEVVYKPGDPLVVTRATTIKNAVRAMLGSIDGGITPDNTNQFLNNTNCDAYILRIDTLANMATYDNVIELANFVLALQLRGVMPAP